MSAVSSSGICMRGPSRSRPFVRLELLELETRQLLTCVPPLIWCTDDTFTQPPNETGGHVSHDVNGLDVSASRAHAVELQTVGQEERIVTAGYTLKSIDPPVLRSEWALSVLRNDGIGSDGQLHPDFNNGQAINYPFGDLSDPLNGEIDSINAVAIAPNGDIIVAGQVWTTGMALSQQVAGVMRFKGTGPDAGKPDLTFGGDCNDKTIEGICMTDDPGEVSIRWPSPGILHYARRNVASAVAIQSIDGFNKIVIGGWADFSFLPVMPGKWLAVARLCPDGSLDNGVNCGPTGFGDVDPVNPALRTGRTTFKIQENNEVHALVAIDLKIIVVGQAMPIRSIAPVGPTPVSLRSDFAIARLCPDGKLDNGKPAPDGCGGAGFGGATPNEPGSRSGIRLVDFFGRHDVAWDVVVQNMIVSGELYPRFIVVGSSSLGDGHSRYALAALDRNGDLDHKFGAYGKRLFGVDNIDVAYGVALQPPQATNPRIVIAGYSRDSVTGTPYISGARLNAHGTGTPEPLRSNFATTVSGDAGDQARGVVVQADGKIVAAGLHATSTGETFGIVRFCNNPAPTQPCAATPPMPTPPLKPKEIPAATAEPSAEFPSREIIAKPVLTDMSNAFPKRNADSKRARHAGIYNGPNADIGIISWLRIL